MSVNNPRYVKLRDAVLDERASQAEQQELEQLILGSDELKRDFAQHLHLQAGIAWQLGTGQVAPMQTELTAGTNSADPPRLLFGWRTALAMAATFLSVAIGFWFLRPESREEKFAVIASAADCDWGECTLPTSVGVGLGEGRLRLNSGIATIEFPHVAVTIEGTVDLEILDRRSCRVLAGKLFTDVSPGGEGFTVLTPTAHFVDRGTRFGVEVDSSGVTSMSVVQGMVSVRHLSSETMEDVLESERVVVSHSGLDRQQGEEFGGRLDLANESLEGLEPVLITTAAGRGDDAYVVGDVEKDRYQTSKVLLVKRPANSEPGKWYAAWRRKAFLRFDLAPVGSRQIESAVFQIHGVDTGIGYRALMPDAQFSVYGLLDEEQDAWQRKSLGWTHSPASQGELLDPDPAEAVLLDRFVVKQSKPDASFQIDSQALLDFVRADSNGLVTLIIVCDTTGSEGETYVHGFASWRHPTLTPPSLRLMAK